MAGKKFYFNTSLTTEKLSKQLCMAPTFVTDEKFSEWVQDVQNAYNYLHAKDTEDIRKQMDGVLAGLLGILDDEYCFTEHETLYPAEKIEELEKGSEAQKKLATAIRAWKSIRDEELEYQKLSAGIQPSKLAFAFIVGMGYTKQSTNYHAKTKAVVDLFVECGNAFADGKAIPEKKSSEARKALCGMYSDMLTEAGYKGIQKITSKWFFDILCGCYPLPKRKKSTFNQKKETYTVAGFKRQKISAEQAFVGIMRTFFFHYGCEATGKQEGKKKLELF